MDENLREKLKLKSKTNKKNIKILGLKSSITKMKNLLIGT